MRSDGGDELWDSLSNNSRSLMTRSLPANHASNSASKEAAMTGHVTVMTLASHVVLATPPCGRGAVEQDCGPLKTHASKGKQVIAPGRGETICPRIADGSSTRGGSTSVRGRVRSPPMAKLQAASVPIA